MKKVVLILFVIISFESSAQHLNSDSILNLVGNVSCKDFLEHGTITRYNLVFVDTVEACELGHFWRVIGNESADSINEVCENYFSAYSLLGRPNTAKFGWTITKEVRGYRLVEIFSYNHAKLQGMSILLIIIDRRNKIVLCSKYSHQRTRH